VNLASQTTEETQIAAFSPQLLYSACNGTLSSISGVE